MQPHPIPVLTALIAVLVGVPGAAAADAAAESTIDALSPILGPAAPPETAVEGPVHASSEAPAPDAAWGEFLEGLNESVAVENPTNPAGTAVDGPSMPAESARGVAFLALFLLLGMLAHPRTRGLVLARLGRAPALPDVDAGAIEILARRELGGGRRLVTVTVDQRRLLIGVGPQRIEVLDRWIPGAPALAEATVLADEAAAPILVEPPAAAPPDDEPAPVEPAAVDSAPVEPAPTPQVAELLAAWRKASTQVVPPTATDLTRFAAEKDESETPWWLDGADDDERDRLLSAAQEPQMRAPAPPPPIPVASPAASVLARLRSSRVAAEAAEARAQAPRKKVAGGGRRAALLVLLFAVAMLLPLLSGLGDALAAEIPDAALKVDLGDGAGAASAVKLLVTLTFLAVLPALVLSMTSFTRLIVVFSMLRQALAVQQAPPNQILIGLALFLTWFIMGPTFERVNEHAVAPYMDGQMTEVEAVEAAMVPMREFMLRNTRPTDLALFLQVSRSERPATRAEVPTRVLVPAFLISELKTAFQIGFLIYIPFLVIDLVVSTVLLAMGMMVLPPVVISLPFKLLLFVFVDGWNLLAGSLVKGFA